MASTPRTASLSFDPVSTSVKEGDVIPVQILIYTGSENVMSTDVWISYNPDYFIPAPTKQSVIEAGTLFQKVNAKVISPGSLYVFGINESASSTPANGSLATFFLQAVKSGSSEIRFQCNESGTLTSQIIKQNESLDNIINCGRTTSHTAQIAIKANSSVLGASTASQSLNSWLFVGFGMVLGMMVALLIIRYRRLQKLLAETE